MLDKRVRGTALRRVAERGVPPPVLHISGLEHLIDQSHAPAIVDLLRQDVDHQIMIERPETVRDVSLDEPVGPFQTSTTSVTAVWQPGGDGNRGNGRRTAARSRPQATDGPLRRPACPTRSAGPAGAASRSSW